VTTEPAAIDWRAVLPADAPLPPEAYRSVVEAFVAGLREVLGDDVVSVYLYGAVTFPRPADWGLLDVDFHTLLGSAPTDDQRDGLRALHAGLAEASDLGRELDGYHLLLADAGRPEPPASVAGAFPSTAGAVVAGPVDDAWALHRAHVHAGRVAVLHGRDPRTVLTPPTWPEQREALAGELDYVVDHPEHAAFGVLNACRIAWSVEHRDVVVSKHEAARWGSAARPAWAAALAAGVRAYSARPHDDDERLLEEGRAAIVPAAAEALASAG
jgi:hypothetical protein